MELPLLISYSFRPEQQKTRWWTIKTEFLQSTTVNPKAIAKFDINLCQGFLFRRRLNTRGFNEKIIILLGRTFGIATNVEKEIGPVAGMRAVIVGQAFLASHFFGLAVSASIIENVALGRWLEKTERVFANGTWISSRIRSHYIKKTAIQIQDFKKQKKKQNELIHS